MTELKLVSIRQKVELLSRYYCTRSLDRTLYIICKKVFTCVFLLNELLTMHTYLFLSFVQNFNSLVHRQFWWANFFQRNSWILMAMFPIRNEIWIAWRDRIYARLGQNEYVWKLSNSELNSLRIAILFMCLLM